MEEIDKSFNDGMKNLDYPPALSSQKKQPKSKRKILTLLSVLIFVTLLFVGGYTLFFKKDATAPAESAVVNNDNPEEAKGTLRLILTGDMIPHDAINAAAKQEDGTYEYSDMFGSMKQLFDASDVRFCNQAVLGGGEEFGITGYPKFNAPIEFSRDMAELGCNVINTGTNHTNDFAQDVINSSVDAWQGQPGVLAVAGANKNEMERQKVRYFEYEDVRFAFVSYTTYTNEPSPNGYSVTMYDEELAKTQLAEARSKADIVIASMRWGTEYSSDVNSQQKTLAQNIANFGADVIVGHGPHVLQSVEKIVLDDGREAYAWYSLGNFINSQLDPETLFNVIGVMDIHKETKRVQSVAYIPIYMHYEWTAEEKARGDVLARRNFTMTTLDEAAPLLERAQLDTTIEVQRERINSTITALTEVTHLTKDQYLK